jgi:acid stress chaperone HdeB
MMNKFAHVSVTLALLAFATVPAPAQVTIDVTKITCDQFLLFSVADPHDIAIWLSGFYNGKKNNTVIDTQQFKEHARKLNDLCQSNIKMTVMEAAEKLLAAVK